MHAFATDPALRLYALTGSLVALHLIVLAGYTGRVRTQHKAFVNPEDAVALKGTQVEADHPDVMRVKRAHQNALENAVPFFAVVSFRHPDCLYRLPIPKSNQVSNGSIGRHEALFDPRQANRYALLAKPGTQLLRQGQNFLNRRDSLAVNAFKQLLHPIARLSCLLHQSSYFRGV